MARCGNAVSFCCSRLCGSPLDRRRERGDERIDPADDAHELGLSLAKKGDSEGARASFIRSLAQRRMPKTLLNLCVVEHRLGHDQEAMAYCYEYVDVTEDREKVLVLRDGLMKEIALRLGKVAVQASVGEVIEVDGKAIDTAPLARPVSLSPGWHDNLALVQGILLRANQVTIELRESIRAVVRYAKLRGLLAEFPQRGPRRFARSSPGRCPYFEIRSSMEGPSRPSSRRWSPHLLSR